MNYIRKELPQIDGHILLQITQKHGNNARMLIFRKRTKYFTI